MEIKKCQNPAVLFWGIWLLFVFFSTNPLKAQSFQMQQGIKAFNEGNYSLATELLEADLRENPYSRPSYIFLAAAYLHREFPILAENTAENGYEIFGNEAGFLWLKAEALLQQKKPEKAAEIYSNLDKHYNTLSFTESLDIDRNKIQQRWIEAELAVSGIAYNLGNLEKALESVNVVLRLAPEHEAALKNRLFLYSEFEEWEKVVELADDALKILGNDKQLIGIKASAHYHLDELDRLLDEYEKLYRKNPDDIDTAITYAEILYANQKGGDAEDVFITLLEKYPDNKRVYREFAKLQERRLYINAKISVLEAMIEQFPGDKEAYRDLTETLESQEEWEKAREYYRKWMELADEKKQIHQSIARTYINEKKMKHAEAYLYELMNDFPDEPGIKKDLAAVLQELEKWEESIEILEALEDAWLLSLSGVRLGNAYFETDDTEAAKNVLEQLLELGLEEPEAYLILSKIYQDTDDDQSLVKAEKAILNSIDFISGRQADIEERMDHQGLAGVSQTDADDIEYYNEITENTLKFLSAAFERDDVENSLQKLLEVHEEASPLRYSLAEFYAEDNQFKASKKILTELLSDFPSHFDSHYLLGRVHEQMGDFPEAAISYERALGLEPDSEQVYRGIIRSYMEMGKVDELADRFKRRYEVNTNNDVLKEHLIEVLHRANRFEEAGEIADQ